MKKSAFIWVLPVLIQFGLGAADIRPTVEDLEQALQRQQLWLNNKIGKSEQVLRPWAPISWKEQGSKLIVGVTEREYRYENSLFPIQITSKGKNILSTPIHLVIDGKKLDFPAIRQLIQRDEHQVRFLSSTDFSGQFSVAVNTTVEFDGFMWFELTLSPLAPGASMDSLQLNIPLDRRRAKYLVRHPVYEVVQPERGLMPDGELSIPFNCSVMFKDDEVGFGWFAESDQYWDARDGHKDQIRIIPEANTSLLRLELIKKYRKIERSVTYRFGIMATPNKPMPRNWRSDKVLWSFGVGAWFWSNSFGAAIDPLMDEGYRKSQRYTGNIANQDYFYTSFRYYGPTPLYSGKRIFAEHFLFSKVMEEVPPSQAKAFDSNLPPRSDFKFGDRNEYMRASVKGMMTDLYLYNVREAVRKYNLRSIYFDALGCRPGINHLHGAGYIDENGERQPTVPLLACRDAAKRLYTMMDDETNGEFHILFHGWETDIAPLVSFCHARLSGEELISAIGNNGNYIDVIKEYTMRGYYRGAQFGVTGVLVPEFHDDRNKLSAPTEEFVMMLLLNDVTANRKFCNQRVVGTSYQVLYDYGLESVDFIPYWDSDQVLKVNDPKVRVSVYTDLRKPEHTVFIVGNLNRKPCELTMEFLKPEWKTVGKLRDLINNIDIKVVNGKAEFPVVPASFRLLAIPK